MNEEEKRLTKAVLKDLMKHRRNLLKSRDWAILEGDMSLAFAYEGEIQELNIVITKKIEEINKK